MNEQMPLNAHFSAPVSLARRARPFVKWAGGKGQLLSTLRAYIPSLYERYYEPFVGGGAMYFSLQAEHSVVSDLNGELINAYQVVKDSVEELIQSLHQHVNEKDYFYRVREWNPADLTPIMRASRFVYLNKTCYNGLYRVNQAGKFNVPFGKYPNPTICDEEGLRDASAALATVEVLEADFESAVSEAGENDFIYMDPPYVPLNVTSSFTSYTANGFGVDDQARLASVVQQLSYRGCRVLLTNSDAPPVRELYDNCNINVVMAPRSINADGNGRGPVTELVITNYDPETFRLL